MPAVAEVPSSTARSSEWNWARFLLFAATLFLFFGLASSGTPTALRWLAFAAYAVASIALAHGNYSAWMHGVHERPPRWLGVLLILAGSTLSAIGYWMLRPSEDASAAIDNGDAVLLVGIIAIYLGAGLLIMFFRGVVARDGLGKRATAGLLAGSAVIATLAVIALLNLAQLDLLALVLLLPILVVPAFVGVLSESAIRGLTDNANLPNSDRQVRRRIASGLGWALLAGTFAFGIFGLRGESIRLVVLVMTALALLVVALASSTLADVAIVLAAVAAIGITPQPQAVVDGPTGSSSSVLVALGDSYMSGEGSQSFIAGTDEGRGGDECRRSRTAWAAGSSPRSWWMKEPPRDPVVAL